MGPRFTHVINPFHAKAGTEHFRAQSVTYASIRRAIREAAEQGIAVDLVCAVLREDLAAVEEPGQPVVIERTIQNISPLKPVRSFPLLADLLDAGFRQGTGQYLIYTNVDISLQPSFYIELSRMIDEAPQPPAAAEKLALLGATKGVAFSINRRTIGNDYQGAEELERMYADPGQPHPGHDCFVFPREWVPRLKLGNVCIATRHFDGLLIANLDAMSGLKFVIHKDAMLTFHLGDDQTWLSRPAYDEHNLGETIRSLRELAKEYPSAGEGHFGYLYRGYMGQVGFVSSAKRKAKNWLIQRGIHKPGPPGQKSGK